MNHEFGILKQNLSNRNKGANTTSIIKVTFSAKFRLLTNIVLAKYNHSIAFATWSLDLLYK